MQNQVIKSMEETNLIRFFGDTPFMRILDAFIDNIGEDYSKKEIQELAGISKAALFAHWSKLEGLRLVRVTRAFGKAKLYTLNTESELVKQLLKLEEKFIEETSPK